MTPSKSSARFILGLFVVFGLVVMGMPGISLGQIPVVQQTTSSPSASPSGSRSPSASATPTPTATPVETKAIQWLNPSSHSTVISTKDDGTNTNYHLVAVAKSPVPSNAVVEFKYQTGSTNEVSLGLPTRVGADTFENFWNVGNLADGSYTLKAIMFVNGVEIARDEIDATINNDDAPLPPDPQAETVEIVSPTNAGMAGFYQPPGAETPRTVMTVTASEALAFPSLSTGTDSITAYYTRTPLGQEPQWIVCAEGVARTEGQQKIACALEAGHSPAQVTGLAAVPASATGVADGSGDAHRVFAYVQQPTSISLTPSSQSGRPPGSCSDSTTATVLDQNGQPIAGVNTDVHAKGPTDNLRFDSGGAAHQAPDKAHTAPEQGWNCSSSAAAGQQGDHELPPGDPDIKHIESTTGTNNDGRFDFRLYSPDGPGTTQFAVWADTDGDDLWCATEASSRGSLTWGSSASPSPTPSGSPSGSPTPSQTPSQSPSQSPTPSEPSSLGPDRASCPAQSPSPTSTASQTPGPSGRSVSLAASRSRVRHGRQVTLSGRVSSSETSCVDNESVAIRRRIHGTDQFKGFKSTTSDGSGDFSVTFKPGKSADYEARVARSDDCDAATSAVEAVRVRVKITREVSSASVPSGGEVAIVGKVIPNHKRTKVLLQRKKGDRWVKVAKDGLNKRSRYRFEVDVTWDGKRRFRVVWPKQHPDHIKGKSRPVVVRAT